MPGPEVITVLLLVLVGIIASGALYLGLLGMLGGVSIVRCVSCRHFTFTFSDGPSPSCAQCRHPRLLHPLRAFHGADR